jgi:peroxiredoxin
VVGSTQRLAVGDRAPAITLPAVDQSPTSDWPASPATVVVFTANGCPFARSWHDRIQVVARDYADRGVRVLQLISNDATDHPEDGPEAMTARVAAGDFAGPLLHDADQALAQAYGATATPEVFVVDRTGIVRYHGAPDGDHDDPSQNALWLRDALDDVLAGRPVGRPETSPAGCSIKWRVELRWWEGCPTHDRAEELLTRTLVELNRGEVHVVRREVRTRDEAKALGFVGSPTFAVGGRDLFGSDAQPALTCRLYRSDGRSGPLPSSADLADRLRSALARPWDLPGWVDPRKPSQTERSE